MVANAPLVFHYYKLIFDWFRSLIRPILPLILGNFVLQKLTCSVWCKFITDGSG